MDSAITRRPGHLGVRELAEGLRSRTWRSAELVQTSLDAAAQTHHTLRAFVEMEPDALDAARSADLELGSGKDRGPLHGLPFAVKDIIGVSGRRMRAGSAAYAEIAHRDADIVAALRAKGAVLVGRTRLHEIAFGPTGVNGFDGGARNPLDPSRIPGGSSSGSAVAVAAGICPIALGTDTGGSCRIPAACCGIVGYKPTIGRLSNVGVMPLSATLDHVGFLARSVEDAWFGFGAASGLESPPLKPAVPQRVGVLREAEAGADSTVRDGMNSVRRTLEEAGVRVDDVDLAPSAIVAEVTATIMFYEAFRVHRDRLTSTPDLFGPDVRARLSEGAAIAQQAYEDALATRERLCSQIERLFHNFPIIVSPTLPIAPPTIGEISDPNVRGLLPRNTRLFNLVGCPAVTIPIPHTPLPVGLHVAAPRGADAALMSAASAIARALG